ncbi:hypothetical protein [Formosa sp. PL04]|uniref:tetratricopeptide repeat protein n=1 Tax=Formosa sp. PL04 TaxID=3081755 RepID=UPI0029827BB0|nr:hypothetical protein [Formosa sp. PL04]MDW5289815.1 hypothetical protein [Formosa sp. PL04]
MKTTLNLLIFSIFTCAIFYFFYSFGDDKFDYSKKIGANAIGCTSTNFLLSDVDSTKQIAPLFENIGNHSYKVSTTNDLAQRFFNQGLSLTYAFNHAEAHRSFMEASRLDPDLAMAYWGQAYTLGPNINDPEPTEDRKESYNKAMLKANKHIAGTTKKERDLIQALGYRYSNDFSTPVEELNLEYMIAMAKVVKKYPKDPDILTLYAASVMNTARWNYWDKNGNPMPNIKDAKEALEFAMKENPNHPGAHHYYIHMVELPTPELAVPSAEILGELMPGAGHIVHMPSHIYIRVGRYKDAVEVNKKAILADEDYISQCFSQGIYPLGYYPHNIHFLWSAASLLGDSKTAIDAAKKTAEKVPVGEMEALHFLQNFAATPLLAYVRFGKWNDILTYPKPNDDIKYLKLIWHYARGIAFIKKHNIPEAKEELEAIKTYTTDPDMETIKASGFDNGTAISKLAYEVVSGELANEQGDFKEAIAHLEQAVILEDNLIYNEPSAWYIPPRQNLGAVLMNANQFEKAEVVYKEDLNKLRQNGWSLMGLSKSLSEQGKTIEAEKIKTEFDKAWQYSDITIENSVL